MGRSSTCMSRLHSGWRVPISIIPVRCGLKRAEQQFGMIIYRVCMILRLIRTRSVALFEIWKLRLTARRDSDGRILKKEMRIVRNSLELLGEAEVTVLSLH